MADDASVARGDGAADSIFGSDAPDPQPQIVAADDHQLHPLFAAARSAGRAGGRGGRSGRAGRAGRALGDGGAAAAPDAPPAPTDTTMALVDTESSGPQFAPISSREIEFNLRRTGDGAESSIFSDEEDDYERVVESTSQRPKKKRRGSNGRPVTDAGDEAAMAAAAFGGVDEDDEDGDADGDEDEEEDGSEAPDSSFEAPILPIRGESCVGCTADRSIVEVVDKFVRKHAVSMSETALYRSAAIYYHREIVEPRRREGVRVQPWKWKDVRAHYCLHCVDPVLQRAAAVRSLGQVRAVQEQSLMKIMPDGSKQLDTKGAELLLKIVALQDKQILALDSARMPPPPSRGGR